MAVLFEKEIIAALGLPSIPKREWDGKSSFDKGVAVVTLRSDFLAYAVAKFDAETDKSPRIVKVFANEPFHDVKQIFVVPNYIVDEKEVPQMDLDEVSKKRAEELLKEAKDIETEGVEDEIKLPDNEYYFDNIKNDDEARAFIQNYNSRNRIKGRIPTTHEGLVMRLSVIYSELSKKEEV